jgi:hypothetical protein
MEGIYMSSIYHTVVKILETGVLSTDDEIRLKFLLKGEHTCQDSDALAILKHAIIFGHVKRKTSLTKKTSFQQYVTLRAS